MRKALLICICCLLIPMSACSSDGADSVASEAETTAVQTTAPVVDTTEATMEVVTEEATAETEKDVLFSSQTSEITTGIDEYLIEIVQSYGIVLQSDSTSISFSAPQSLLDQIAADYRKKINEASSEEHSNPESTLRYAVISEDYQTIDYYVTDGFSESLDSLALLLYAHPMCQLQCLTGVSAENVSYIGNERDARTGEIISSHIYPDDMQTE